jgi:hypothetical protein
MQGPNLTGQPKSNPADIRHVVEWLIEVYAATGKADETGRSSAWRS